MVLDGLWWFYGDLCWCTMVLMVYDVFDSFRWFMLACDVFFWWFLMICVCWWCFFDVFWWFVMVYVGFCFFSDALWFTLAYDGFRWFTMVLWFSFDDVICLWDGLWLCLWWFLLVEICLKCLMTVSSFRRCFNALWRCLMIFDDLWYDDALGFRGCNGNVTDVTFPLWNRVVRSSEDISHFWGWVKT